MNVYILECSLSEGYKKFKITSKPNPLDLFTPLWEKCRTQGVSIRNEWPEIRIASYRAPDQEKYYPPCTTEGDFMSCPDFHEPVLSERAYEALHKIIEPCVEFLPLTSYEGNYVTYRVLTVHDASVLDLTRSELKWDVPRSIVSTKEKTGIFVNPSRPCSCYSFVDHFFYEEKIANTPIFHLREHSPAYTFVTDAVANCIKDNNLTGVKLCQVHPPQREELRRQAYEKMIARRQRKNRNKK